MAIDLGPELNCFTVLHPDNQVSESFEDPHVVLDLDQLFTGPLPYVTLCLDEGLELHHQPGTDAPENAMATALAAHCGFGGVTVCGAAYLTGASGETDAAPGMDGWATVTLYRELRQLSRKLDAHLWRRIPADHYVLVEPQDHPHHGADGHLPTTAQLIRADLAPAGYWQRTGNQLLPVT